MYYPLEGHHNKLCFASQNLGYSKLILGDTKEKIQHKVLRRRDNKLCFASQNLG